MNTKICRICGKLKILNNFPKGKGMRDGYRNECKECIQKIYYNKEKIRKRHLDKEIKIEGEKICRICNKEKNLSEFHIKRGTSDGHRSECNESKTIILKKYKKKTNLKEKQKEYDKTRYVKKKEEILKNKIEYYKENQEHILLYKKFYRENNKDSIKEWRKNNKDRLAELQSDYRKRYPHVIAWRSVLYSTLKRLGTPKEGHTIDMLGYSALQLKEHIENQFLSGMTWNNHGTWDIDHIIPVVSFTSDTPISIVCALDNLQPLWKKDNLEKSDKIILRF